MKVKSEALNGLSHTCDIEDPASISSEKVVIINTPSQSCPDVISLKARKRERSLGHTVLTPVRLKTTKSNIGGMAIELLWAYRGNRDIAVILVNKAFEILRKRGCPFVAVIGRPDYYSRFGFQYARNYNITNQASNNQAHPLMIHFISHIPDRTIAGQIHYSKVLDNYYN